MPHDPTGILVVDDDPLIRSICRKVVESHGFDPILAENGAEGLSIFRDRRVAIALVLSDISMPEMNGIEMVREMFTIQPHANIILMTGYSTHDLPGELQKLCALIYKPFTPRQLGEAIKKCLDYEEKHSIVAEKA